jgi:hypothetical protein
VKATSSRDHLISRLEAASTGVFYSRLDFPDKHQFKFPFVFNFYTDCGRLGSIMAHSGIDFKRFPKSFSNSCRIKDRGQRLKDKSFIG